jgi:hypothetical protein
MVRSSIDLTLQRGGQGKTQNALLDYRYIDSFVKLVVVLLKTFDFNKQEFMSRIFEFVRVKLDEDHNSQ